jgi:hypothetical protein
MSRRRVRHRLPNAEDDFARLLHIPVFRAWREKTGHGVHHEPNGGAFSVAVAWVQWQLQVTRAAAMFVGANCGPCSNPEWHVRKKGIDKEETAVRPPAPGLAFASSCAPRFRRPCLARSRTARGGSCDITGDVRRARHQGTVCPGGADWQIVRADGFTELDTRYTIETDKGNSSTCRTRGCATPRPTMQKLGSQSTRRSCTSGRFRSSKPAPELQG